MRLLLRFIRNLLQTEIIPENVVPVRQATTDVNVITSNEKPAIDFKVKEPLYKKPQISEPASKDYVTYNALKDSPLVNKPYVNMLKYEHSILMYGDLSQNIKSDYLKLSGFEKAELLQGRQLVGILTSKRDETKAYFRNSEEIEIIGNALVSKKSTLVLLVIGDEVTGAGVFNPGDSVGVASKARGPVKEGLEKMANSGGFKEVCRLDIMMDFYKDNHHLPKKKQEFILLKLIDQYKKETGIELSYDWFITSRVGKKQLDDGFFRIYQKMDSSHFNGEQAIATLMSSSDQMDLALSIAETTRDSQYKEEFLNIVNNYPLDLLDKHAAIADSDGRFKYLERLDFKDRIIVLGHDKNPLLKNKLKDGCANWPSKFAESEKEVEITSVEEEGVEKIGWGE